jgi:membrane protein implicated in regulation of membrane protease activity
MTGTPLDLTPFGSVLTGIGILYWLLALAAAGFALWLPKRWWVKLLCATAVLAAFVYPVATHVEKRKQQHDESKDRLAKAMAQFEMRCKSAGEKISRTVESVEGVVWMRWRDTNKNDSDQFKLDDPYGHDCGDDACIGDLLRVSKGAELNPDGAKHHTKGYRFVETTDPSGQRYRYVGAMKLRPIWTEEAIAREKKLTGKGAGPSDHVFSLERQPISQFTARYGITWDDISTREDREHWIAGGSLKVIDLQTNEVVAERVGYMMDRGLGSKAGFRSPWGAAPWNACPAFAQAPGGGPFRSYRTRDFVLKVLQTKQGE